VPTPINEQRRLQALREYNILDTEGEEQFERLTRVVQSQLDVKIALISLVDAERQWFKACAGLEGGPRETPRSEAFCAHAILSDDTMIVLDAREDPRFAENPLVTGEPNIRFYMGAPLITPEGLRIGTLCAIDDQPWFSVPDKMRLLLEDLAKIVVDELELRRVRMAKAETAARELERSERRGDAAERAKTQFLAMMGHELRTPLNGVISAAHVIQQARSAEQMQDMADVVIESAGRMERTINALLTYAALDRNELTLREESVNVAEKLASVVKLTHAAAVEREVTVNVSADPHIVLADRVQLGEAVAQLLLNAIVHGPRGGRVDIRCTPAASGDIDIAVLDQGPGLPHDALERALEAFEQLDGGLNRSAEGMGLGLPLAQKLAELHGGGLTLHARPGGGACAAITLPAWRVMRPSGDAEKVSRRAKAAG